jgi:hypothetical protein
MQAGQPSFWRRILSALGLGGSGAGSSHGRPRPAAHTGHGPDPSTFEPGDFVWPKRKGAIIVRAVPPQAGTLEQLDWEAQRDRLFAQPTRSLQASGVAERLKSMRYEEFERYYFEGASESAVARGIDIGGVKLSVGHVAIIEIDQQGVPFVIEAVPTGSLAVLGGGTVQRTPYREWLTRRPDDQLWHGRVKELDRGVRARIPEAAARHLGKPYDFFNFDLDDDSGFYCSKLAWMSVWRSASIAVDDDPDPLRGNRFPPWLSPRQLLNSRRILVLRKPDEF